MSEMHIALKQTQTQFYALQMDSGSEHTDDGNVAPRSSLSTPRNELSFSTDDGFNIA